MTGPRPVTREASEARARAAIAANLLIMISRETERERFREVLDEPQFDMELGASLVVGIGVLPVEGEAGRHR